MEREEASSVVARALNEKHIDDVSNLLFCKNGPADLCVFVDGSTAKHTNRFWTKLEKDGREKLSHRHPLGQATVSTASPQALCHYGANSFTRHH